MEICSSFGAGLVPTPATCSVSSPWSQMTFKGLWSVAISLGVSTMRKQPSPLPNEDYGPKPDHSARRAGAAVLFACGQELKSWRAIDRWGAGEARHAGEAGSAAPQAGKGDR